MGIKHVAYLIALTVDTTYWGSYTDLIPHISLFCMWQQNQKEINGIFIHFTHYLSSKSLQSILEISTTYRHNLHPTQEQYFSTKKLPFPLPPWGRVGSDESPGHKVQYFKALPNCNKIFFLFY